MMLNDQHLSIQNLLAPLTTINQVTPAVIQTINTKLADLSQLLIEKNCDPQKIYNLLLIQNSVGISLGMASAVTHQNHIALKYISLLTQLLESGITVQQIYQLLLKASKRQTFGMVIAFEQTEEVLKAYFALLNLLLVNGLSADDMYNLLSQRDGNVTFQTRIIHNKESASVALNFGLWETLIKKGLSPANIKELSSLPMMKGTMTKFLVFLKEDPARLYRYINLDILPDEVYPLIKDMKEKIFDYVLTTSRSDILNASLQVTTKGTPMNRHVAQKRGLFATRAGHGMFKRYENTRDGILAAMEKEPRPLVRVAEPIRQPIAPITKFKVEPIPVPSAPPQTEMLYLVPRLYPYQVQDQNGSQQWIQPPIASDPPPSFASDEADSAEISLPPTRPIIQLPEGPLINFMENEKPKPAPVAATLLADMFPPVPRQEPSTVTHKEPENRKLALA